jgi:phage protein U
MIGSLGEVSFITSSTTIRTFSNLTRNFKARYARHEVIGKKPVLEFLGPDTITIPLTIRLDITKGVNPTSEIENLTTKMESGTDEALVIGNKYLGQFVIKSIDESDTFIDNKGVVRIANITMNLEEYADDRV